MAGLCSASAAATHGQRPFEVVDIKGADGVAIRLAQFEGVGWLG